MEFNTLYFETEDDIKLNKLFLTNCDNFHNKYYDEFKFIVDDKYNEINLSNEQEIIKCEGFKFCTLKNDECISNSLRNGKLFEKFLLAYLTNFVPKNKNVLDIGANIGIWSIVYNTVIAPENKIYSFEPQSKIFDCLEKNVTLNNCKNILTYNFALSNINETMYMNASYDNIDNFGAFAITGKNDNVKQIEIVSKIGDSFQFDNIGFIKIDVEGHELEVIDGLKNTIQKFKPVIFIEIHESTKTCNRTLKYLYDLGYRKYLKLTHCDYLFSYF